MTLLQYTMPPKGKAIDMSSASVVDLKAQLAQHTDEFQRRRAGAKYGPASDRPSNKKPTVWARQNKGVSARSKQDMVQHITEVESQSLTRSREALERKAKVYEAMRKRIRADDEDDEDEGLLIDFDRKYWEEREHQEKHEAKRKRTDQDVEAGQGDGEEKDDDDDPWVEYEDEFGRTRTVRRSQLPRERSPSRSPSPSSPRSPVSPSIAEPADRASIRHYDSGREVRTRGVGFYQFAHDEQERAEQMERLSQIRQETEAARKNVQSVAERRKAMLQKNAERVHARRAQLQAKRGGGGSQPQHQQQPQLTVNEESISKFLKAVRSNLK